MFKDHGTGECGNIIKFVSLFTGLTNYSDILNDIVNKLKITMIRNSLALSNIYRQQRQ